MIDWGEIAVSTLKELGSPAGWVDAEKVPRLVKLCGPDRRLTQTGPFAEFQGRVQKHWQAFDETYELRVIDLAALGRPRAIVDHIQLLRVPAAQALAEKIEARIVAKGYDLDRTRCVTLANWWMRETPELIPGKPIRVTIDCICAFGPWIPPLAADEPAIAGKVGE